MMPLLPQREEIDRTLRNLEQGEFDPDAPALEGGIGAEVPNPTPAEQALKQEGLPADSDDTPQEAA